MHIAGFRDCCAVAAKNIIHGAADLGLTDPSAPVLPSGVSQTGNANLLKFLADGYIDDGEPRRYLDLKRLNDELREHGRDALIAYLCKQDRVALPWGASVYATSSRDLSDLLLLDVRAGICEASAALKKRFWALVNVCPPGAARTLEPQWKVSREFAQLSGTRFETYH